MNLSDLLGHLSIASHFRL